MRTLLMITCLCLMTTAMAEDKFGNLDEKDQKYYKNDSREGMNQLERIDSTVRQINVMMGQMNQMKSEIAKLRAEVDELKANKK